MMNLNVLMQNSVHGIVKKAGRYYLRNKRGRAFITNILPQILKSADLRKEIEEQGLHIPPFLIASIASQCNLHCTGCYARVGGDCCENKSEPDLTDKEWENIFCQATGLGVSFILIAGGEPFMRKDVIQSAAKFQNIIFPIFTNGTLIQDDYLDMFDKYRHLIPIFSIEGNQKETDFRRGDGVYSTIASTMQKMHKKNILFGASVTVTHENLNTVLTHSFINELHKRGCGVLFFVEYVPAESGTEYLTLTEEGQKKLQQCAQSFKNSFDDMVVLSFPGDEEAMGGCLASGRGFFHINSQGGAEPCPFSPYSKHNLKRTPLTEVLRSRYFNDLRKLAVEADSHTGGCVLFQKEKEVQMLLSM